MAEITFNAKEEMRKLLRRQLERIANLKIPKTYRLLLVFYAYDMAHEIFNAFTHGKHNSQSHLREVFCPTTIANMRRFRKEWERITEEWNDFISLVGYHIAKVMAEGKHATHS